MDESSINDPSPGFLGNLSPAIRKHQYDGNPLFLEIWKNERQQPNSTRSSEWLLLTDVDEKAFSQYFLNSDSHDSPQWTSYDKVLGLLLIRMTTSITHEDAASCFNNMLIKALVAKRLEPESDMLAYWGSARRESPVGAKQPDFAYLPLASFHNRSQDWPCVVLETAFSESESKLNSDVRFWLNGSEGKVKIVFTIEVHSKSDIITIDKWESRAGRSHRTQHIEIKKGDNNRVYISGQPLVLEFEKLFLRAGNAPQETDIQFDEAQLKSLALHVWETYSKEYPN